MSKIPPRYEAVKAILEPYYASIEPKSTKWKPKRRKGRKPGYRKAQRVRALARYHAKKSDPAFMQKCREAALRYKAKKRECPKYREQERIRNQGYWIARKIREWNKEKRTNWLTSDTQCLNLWNARSKPSSLQKP